MKVDQTLPSELAGCRSAGRDERRSRHDAPPLGRPLPTSRRATVRIAFVGQRLGAEGLNSVSSAAAMAVEFLGVSDVAPMHTGRFRRWRALPTSCARRLPIGGLATSWST
jgi:hypothetical protein